MDPVTLEFHETVLRLLKGIVTAYERWLTVMRTKPRTS